MSFTQTCFFAGERIKQEFARKSDLILALNAALLGTAGRYEEGGGGSSGSSMCLFSKTNPHF